MAESKNIKLKSEVNIEELIMDYSHMRKEGDVYSHLRRRWSIFHNRIIIGFFSPFVSIFIALLVILFFWQYRIITLNFSISTISIYYLILLLGMFILSVIILWNAWERYQEADLVELLALKENNIEDILKNIKEISSKLDNKILIQNEDKLQPNKPKERED